MSVAYSSDHIVICTICTNQWLKNDFSRPCLGIELINILISRQEQKCKLNWYWRHFLKYTDIKSWYGGVYILTKPTKKMDTFWKNSKSISLQNLYLRYIYKSFERGQNDCRISYTCPRITHRPKVFWGQNHENLVHPGKELRPPRIRIMEFRQFLSFSGLFVFVSATAIEYRGGRSCSSCLRLAIWANSFVTANLARISISGRCEEIKRIFPFVRYFPAL